MGAFLLSENPEGIESDDQRGSALLGRNTRGGTIIVGALNLGGSV